MCHVNYPFENNNKNNLRIDQSMLPKANINSDIFDHFKTKSMDQICSFGFFHKKKKVVIP